MTVHILVNWPATIAVAAGLVVLVGLTWLLRGGRAAARMCAVTGMSEICLGLGAGKVLTIAGGVVTLGVVCWCLRMLRGDAR
jgi:hypothetical protein